MAGTEGAGLMWTERHWRGHKEPVCHGVQLAVCFQHEGRLRSTAVWAGRILSEFCLRRHLSLFVGKELKGLRAAVGIEACHLNVACLPSTCPVPCLCPLTRDL